MAAGVQATDGLSDAPEKPAEIPRKLHDEESGKPET
jgi:hypothetical protein